jgi:hypothetical protein
VIIESSVRALTEIWNGIVLAEEAVRRREVRVLGKPGDARNVWRWLGTSTFAPTRRYALAIGAEAN